MIRYVSMSSSEMAHKEHCKNHYSSTNGKDVVPQMIERVMEADFFNNMLTRLLGHAVELHPALLPRRRDYFNLFGRMGTMDTHIAKLSGTLRQQFDEAWERAMEELELDNHPFDPSRATRYNGVKMLRSSISEPSIIVNNGVIRVGDFVECLSVNAEGDYEVSNSTNPGTVSIASVAAFFILCWCIGAAG